MFGHFFDKAVPSLTLVRCKYILGRFGWRARVSSRFTATIDRIDCLLILAQQVVLVDLGVQIESLILDLVFGGVCEVFVVK